MLIVIVKILVQQLLFLRLAPDFVYEGKCEVVLLKDNIVVLAPRSLEGSLTITTLSTIIVVPALSGVDKGFSKSKALLEIFRVGGFAIICCMPP